MTGPAIRSGRCGHGIELRGIALAAICSVLPAVAQNSVPEVPPAPEIYLVGSVHQMHFDERYHYSLIDLEAQVRSLHPDVVCGEITPEAYNAPMEGNFPPEAAFLAEMAPVLGIRFIPADWRVSFAEEDRASSRVPGKQAAAMDAEEKRALAYINRFSGVSLYDYMGGSAEFLAMVDYKFEEVIGDNTAADIEMGAWHERNRSIVANCLSQAGPARRIVFVFGSSHLPQLRRQLASRGLVGQIPMRTFTPAGLGVVSAAVITRWQRNLRNLEGIAAGTIPASSDMRARVKDTNRAPVLRSEIEIYQSRQKGH